MWPHFEQAVTKEYPHLKPFIAKFCKDIKTTDDQLIIAEGFSTRDAFTTSFKDINLWMPRCETTIKRYLNNHDNTFKSRLSIQPTLPLTLTALSNGQNPVS